MKLIILGNGFDLHHKYKTSFHDFRTFLQSSKSEKDKHLISQVDEIIGVKNEDSSTHLLWNDFEAIIGKLLDNQDYKKHKIKNIPNLIEEFTHGFYNYLLEINKPNNNFNIKIAEEFENASVVLTFNYTSTYTAYKKSNDFQIFHIHGDLSKNNLPIIGYQYQNIRVRLDLTDYMLRFDNKEIHKSALAFKQNEINFEKRITDFINIWRNKISEIVIIGYSFGQSDDHIYAIINQLLISTTAQFNIPATTAKDIHTISFKIYNYNTDESNKIIQKIKSGLTSQFNRRMSITIFGVGYARQQKDIITFELKEY